MGQCITIPTNYHIFLLCIFVDRHNDLAYELRDIFKNQLGEIDLNKNTSGQYGAAWQTDIPRLRAGHLGGQVSADLYSGHYTWYGF